MQKISRRKFLTLAGLTGAAAIGGIPVLGSNKNNTQKITILHTNDTHSRLDPYPYSHATYPGMGGYARRAALIARFREKDPGLLLLDAGDVFQGTPFYNVFDGEPELKLMSRMKYDAVAVGNHEFDNGLDGFDKVLPHANFPFISANYDFSNTALHGKIKDFITLERNGIKIGIYGLGVELAGLVGSSLYGETKYLEPLEVAKETEKKLKNKHKCRLIICLSHLGFDYGDKKVGDVVIARNTEFTDIIVGGHTHNILDPAHVEQNIVGQPVTIGQAGSNGVFMGMMEVVFGKEDGDKTIVAYTTKISKSQ